MNVCQRCGTNFECGAAGTAPCWCTALPPLPLEAYRPNREDAAASRCFCPDCLRALLAVQNTQAAPAAD